MTGAGLPPGTDELIRRALAEDLGAAGDVTSAATIPAATTVRARLVTRAPGRIAGLAAALRAFGLVDESIATTVHLGDGADAPAGSVLARIVGPARSVLAAERVALNLLAHCSGIATATRRVVELVAGTGATVADTRKTTLGMRALEKEAVRLGGGRNHRFGLYDAVLVKDNHLVLVGSVSEAIRRVRARVGHLVPVEVEVDTLEQLAEALAAGVDAVLLDNMDPAMLREAVRLVDGRCLTEASGGITPENVRAVAETGVDVISLGWLTHSAPALDVGLDFDR